MVLLRCRILTFTVSLVFLALILSGCDVIVVKGSGDVIKQTFDVIDYNEITLNLPAKVIIEQGGVEFLEIETDDNILNLIEATVKNGDLHIAFKDHQHYNIRQTGDVTVRVGVKEINGISINGVAEVTAPDISSDELSLDINGAGEANLDNLHADVLKITISGAGELDISGEVGSQTIQINGIGEYRAGDLLSKDCSVEINGAGEAVVNVSDNLDVSIRGAGEIKYIGNPTISKTVAGAGSLKKIVN